MAGSTLTTALQFTQGSLGSPAADLACDEALLESCETGTLKTNGILRIWEPAEPYIVLGYANRVREEVDLNAAATENVPIYRRCSGGGCVLQNIGCLNYSLILPIGFHPALESVTQTNCFVMQRNRDAVAAATGEHVSIKGYTDLTLGDKKISGNSQRRKLRWLLFHGSFLLACDFKLMERVLRPPLRQPEYRSHRRHSEFLTCLRCAPEELLAQLRQSWNATEVFEASLRLEIDALTTGKYTTDEWNLRW